jgi:peptidoglycan L-alanyl-D-glutamate endopeptidase CwlK
MSKFSLTSKSKLATCHNDLQTLFNHIIEERDCTIVCGYRGEAEQNKAFKEGKSQKRFPESKHNVNPSIAVDVAPFEKTQIDWSKLQSAEFAGYVMGTADRLYREGVMKHRIRSGADWDRDYDVDDTDFWDACHFEIIP